MNSKLPNNGKSGELGCVERKRKRRTSIKLIERATAEGWIKQLAFYHLMKLQFNNSCIYNYHYRMHEIAKLFNMSRRTLYNYFYILRGKGLICDHANNLKLKSIRKYLPRWIKTSLLISPDYTLNETTCLLYLKLIERKAKQMAFAESIRRRGKGDRLIGRLCENPFSPSLSYRNIAKILNCSEYKAFRVIKVLNNLGAIKTVKQKPRSLKNFTGVMIKSVEDLPGYMFEVDGKVYEIFGSKHDFLEFPLFLRSISLKQYLHFKKRQRGAICL